MIEGIKSHGGVGAHSDERITYAETHRNGDTDMVPFAETYAAVTGQEMAFDTDTQPRHKKASWRDKIRNRVEDAIDTLRDNARRMIGRTAIAGALAASVAVGSANAEVAQQDRVGQVVETVVGQGDPTADLQPGDVYINFAGTGFDGAQEQVAVSKPLGKATLTEFSAGPVPVIGPLLGQPTMVEATDIVSRQAVGVVLDSDPENLHIIAGYSQGAIAAKKTRDGIVATSPEHGENTVGVYGANPDMEGSLLDQNREVLSLIPGLMDPERPDDDIGHEVNVCVKWDLICDGEPTVENFLGYMMRHNAFNGKPIDPEYHYMNLQQLNELKPENFHVVRKGNETQVIVDAPRPSIALLRMFTNMPKEQIDALEAGLETVLPNQRTGGHEWDKWGEGAAPQADAIPGQGPVVPAETFAYNTQVAPAPASAPVAPASPSPEQFAANTGAAIEQGVADAGQQASTAGNTAAEYVSSQADQASVDANNFVDHARNTGAIDAQTAAAAEAAIEHVHTTADAIINDTNAAYQKALQDLGLAPR